MKKYLFILIVFYLAISASTVSAALVFNLGGTDFSVDGGGIGSGATLPENSLIMTFEQNGDNTVKLTLNTAYMPHSASKISDVWFNVGGGLSYSDLTFSQIGGVGTKSISQGGNVSSAGIFDVNFNYKTSGPKGTFYYGMTSVYNITATGLVESDFSDLSTGGYFAAMHVNNTGNGESGHYGGSAVPIPASLFLLGSGLIGVVGLGKRRKKSA